MEKQIAKKIKRQIYKKDYDAKRLKEIAIYGKFVKDPFKNKTTHAIWALSPNSLKIDPLIDLIRTKDEYAEIRDQFNDELKNNE